MHLCTTFILLLILLLMLCFFKKYIFFLLLAIHPSRHKIGTKFRNMQHFNLKWRCFHPAQKQNSYLYQSLLEEARYTDSRLINLAESGDFSMLYAVAREHEERDIIQNEERLKNEQPPDLDEQIRRIRRRVARLTRQEEVRRAVQALEGGKVMPIDEETLKQLESLFPHEDEREAMEVEAAKSKVQALSLPKTKDYVKFARKASRVAAPGPTGLQLGVLTMPFRCKPRPKKIYQCREPLQRVTIPIVKNARLVAVPKPNGKARPICIGESIRRLPLALCIVSSSKNLKLCLSLISLAYHPTEQQEQ